MGNTEPASGFVASPPSLIKPNGTAPIGSELQAWRQRQAARTPGMQYHVDSVLTYKTPPKQAVIQVEDEHVQSNEQPQSESAVPVGQDYPQVTSAPASQILKTPQKTDIPATDIVETETVVGEGADVGTESDSEKNFRKMCGRSIQEFHEGKDPMNASNAVSGASYQSSGG